MADNIGNKAAHDYHLDIPQDQEGFFVKGASHCDWGMKNPQVGQHRYAGL